MIDKHDFAYSVALTRTLETLLLNENEVERMTLAKNAEDAFKILNEFDYADNKAGIENVSDFQKVINEGLSEIKETLTKVSPDQKTLNILWHQYDFHNIKTMVKAKLSGKTFADIENILKSILYPTWLQNLHLICLFRSLIQYNYKFLRYRRWYTYHHHSS